MANEEYIFRQAKRIYDDCVTSQKQGTQVLDAVGLADAYNDLLSRAQDTFSDNEVIQSLDEVKVSGRTQQKAQAVQRVKSNTSQLADALDISLSDLENTSGHRELRPITISVNQDVDQTQQQSQLQQQQQYVNIEEVREDVDRSTMPPDNKEALQEVIDEYVAELEGDRDPSRLRQLLDSATDYSVDVTAKLGILGLQYGVTELIT